MVAVKYKDPNDQQWKVVPVGGGIQGLNGCTGLWIGTQAQFDAIGTKDATVVYVVK